MRILEQILSDTAIRKLEESNEEEAIWVFEKLGEVALYNGVDDSASLPYLPQAGETLD